MRIHEIKRPFGTSGNETGAGKSQMRRLQEPSEVKSASEKRGGARL